MNPDGIPANNQNGPARGNSLTGTIGANSLPTNAGPAVSVVGGRDAVTGEVVNNLAKQQIVQAVANTVQCQDGLPGNRAECTFVNSLETRGVKGVEEDKVTGEQGRSARTLVSVSTTFVPQLRAQADEIIRRKEALMARAEETTDETIRQQLRTLCDQLDELQKKIEATLPP